MRSHFENNIFVVSRSPRGQPFAFNHLETGLGLVWLYYVVVTKKRFGVAHAMLINLSKVAECSEVALFEKTFVIFTIKSMIYLRRFWLSLRDHAQSFVFGSKLWLNKLMRCFYWSISSKLWEWCRNYDGCAGWNSHTSFWEPFYPPIFSSS